MLQHAPRIPEYLQLDKIAENLNYSENLLALQGCSGGKMFFATITVIQQIENKLSIFSVKILVISISAFCNKRYIALVNFFPI